MTVYTRPISDVCRQLEIAGRVCAERTAQAGADAEARMDRAIDLIVAARDAAHQLEVHAAIVEDFQTALAQEWALDDLTNEGGTHGSTSELAEPGDEALADLRVESVDYCADGGVRLLHGVDLIASPGTLTAVIGPSGAGKTTFARLVTGQAVPSIGQVVFAGYDLHSNYAALRSRIGFVPQDNVVHGQLTVRQALGYAAELRLPKDTTKAESSRICASAMAELGLTKRANLRVDKLSGGQRKRVSVAIELLTSPTLLVLDEPTSGLDPALDRQVMEMLRDIAQGGRIVVVVTHSLAHLHLTDQVLLLGPGGLPGYLGAPDGIEATFGTNDWANIFQRVVDEPNVLWDMYLHRTGKSDDVIEKIENGESDWKGVACELDRLPVAKATARQCGAVRQATTLIRRQVRLILADVGYFIFLMAVPVALGLLALIVPGSYGFGPQDVGLDHQPSTEPSQLLVLLILGACFMGASLTVRDLVGERPIFFRERCAGVAPVSYLASKLVVFGGTATIQTIVLISIVLLAKPRPGHGAAMSSGLIELTIGVALVAWCSMVLGLLLSSMAKSSEQVMPLLVVLTMAQLVMSGGLVPITGRGGLQQMAALLPSRWAFAAGAATINMRSLLGPAGQPDDLWNHTLGHWWLNVGVLIGMAVVLSVATYLKLRLRVANIRRLRLKSAGYAYGATPRRGARGGRAVVPPTSRLATRLGVQRPGTARRRQRYKYAPLA